MRKSAVLILVLALSALGIAACGSDDSTTSSTSAATTETTSSAAGGGGSTVAVEADPNGDLAYTTGDLTADAGTVEIDFDNPSSTATALLPPVAAELVVSSVVAAVVESVVLSSEPQAAMPSAVRTRTRIRTAGLRIGNSFGRGVRDPHSNPSRGD